MSDECRFRCISAAILHCRYAALLQKEPRSVKGRVGGKRHCLVYLPIRWPGNRGWARHDDRRIDQKLSISSDPLKRLTVVT
jgi:hypothetical protein